MAVGSDVPTQRFSERKRVLLMVDLAGTSRAVAGFEAAQIAALINSFFGVCGAAVASHRGRIVAFLGDGILAVFDEDEGVAAIEAAKDIARGLDGVRNEFGVDVELGANIHQAVVAEGEFEPDGHYNVMGVGVMHTFRMAAGPGIRISEPVYRQLPSDGRSPWKKNKPPAIYTLTGR